MVRFVDIVGIVDYHCLNSFFHKWYFIDIPVGKIHVLSIAILEPYNRFAKIKF